MRTVILGSTLVLACFAAACGDGITITSDDLSVEGSYEVTFATTRVNNCEGFVTPGDTTAILVVDQIGSEVTLRLSDVTEFIRTDPEGTIDDENRFIFEGPITVGNETATVDADGTIEGTFTPIPVPGRVDLTFDFLALGCEVEGTVEGNRFPEF